MYEKFFMNAVSRFYTESAFSDMVWIMCNTIKVFQELFIEYCFDEKIFTNEIIREYSRADSQPDFYFKDMNDQEYIIENKINDHGEHFEQYKVAFPSAKRAFIANYKLPNCDGWKIKTWRGFLKFLQKNIDLREIEFDQFPEDITLTEYEGILGFISYIKAIITK